MMFSTSSSDDVDAFFEAGSQLQYKSPTSMPCKLSIRAKHYLVSRLPIRPQARTQQQPGSEVPLPPHEDEVIIRILVAANIHLASHQRRPREKDTHLFWRCM